MIAVDISRFRDIETFKMKMDEVICRVKKSKKAPGVKEIMIPGEPESLEEEKRLRDGILIPDTVWHEISDVASRLGVTIPLPLQA
jgi:LDH2 family malate/lactate/ureidoglycolate dehydrogenase